VTPDFINYKVTSTSTPYIDGSLRIFVNGVRLTETEELFVPGALPESDLILITFTPSPAEGTFALSTNLFPDDQIRIDFDVELS
jgi:hypothetical protein